jgi:hypothetical protein
MLTPLFLAIGYGLALVLGFLLVREQRRRAHQAAGSDTIIKNISDSFVSLDRDWRFTFISDRAKETFVSMDKDPAKMMGRSYWDEFPATVGTKVETEFNRTLSQKKSATFDFLNPATKRWLEMNSFPTGEGISVFFRDISERKAAVEETQKALRELNDVKAALDQHAIVAITNPAAKSPT